MTDKTPDEIQEEVPSAPPDTTDEGTEPPYLIPINISESQWAQENFSFNPLPTSPERIHSPRATQVDTPAGKLLSNIICPLRLTEEIIRRPASTNMPHSSTLPFLDLIEPLLDYELAIVPLEIQAQNADHIREARKRVVDAVQNLKESSRMGVDYEKCKGEKEPDLDFCPAASTSLPKTGSLITKPQHKEPSKVQADIITVTTKRAKTPSPNAPARSSPKGSIRSVQSWAKQVLEPEGTTIPKAFLPRERVGEGGTKTKPVTVSATVKDWVPVTDQEARGSLKSDSVEVA
ncbi:hypothetical protein BDV96DRAFT_639857 [Lophiotrema nucula]|uniref:Uncharacterized protein n=1 Tax=Lophiotrema nucula TaxID=690887 RepID=A0A6A5ZPZ5_9PLEO|nr:hypothetical protein BDV96DRAFT_639857 [Lophiotrema nucula]